MRRNEVACLLFSLVKNGITIELAMVRELIFQNSGLKVSSPWCIDFMRGLGLSCRRVDAAHKTSKWSKTQQKATASYLMLMLLYLCRTENAPFSRCISVDESGLLLCPAPGKTWTTRGRDVDSSAYISSKQQCTLGLALPADPDIPCVAQIVWKGKTERSHPKDAEQHPHLLHCHSETHWQTESTLLEMIAKVEEELLAPRNFRVSWPCGLCSVTRMHGCSKMSPGCDSSKLWMLLDQWIFSATGSC